MKKKVTVALLSGGTSTERAVSLTGGNQVCQALSPDRYDVRRYDPATDIPRLIADASNIDVALIILHGTGGEDGTVQGLLDLLNIPYQCSGPLGSAIAMNKLASKRLYLQAGIPVPGYMSFNTGDTIDVDACVVQLGLPIVVKPASGGSSIGMDIVRSKDRLRQAFDKAFALDHTILLEEYIAGTEITGAVLGNSDLQALPLVEIIPEKNHDFFDYEAKYKKGETREICPARISGTLTEKAQHLAAKAHEALFCKGYSRTDMIVRGDDLYVLETNTIPGMTPESLLPLAAKASGMDFGQLLDRLIALGLEKHYP
ncbi:MAG: D-alanine--D-alanine ligase [Desulfosalsimonadaceae bacterium]